jgi:hypothetical protein
MLLLPHVYATALVSLLDAAVATAMPAVNAYTYKHGRALNGRTELPDLVHMTFPKMERLGRVADAAVVAAVVAYVAVFALSGRGEYLYLLAAAASLFQGVAYLYFVCTVLPDSRCGECTYSSSLRDTLSNMGSCNDLNISVHLLYIAFTLAVLAAYLGAWFVPFAALGCVASAACITISRNHYTVDCLNSAVVAALVFAHRNLIIDALNALTGHRLRRVA